jgi:pimeloyl-ACP methyl ester carboxylesterase
MHVVERHVDLGDVHLSIAEAGAGGRPLLLVHGFTGAKEDFTPWFDRLANVGWHPVAPDLRGHGASSKPTADAAYSLEILADDVLRLPRSGHGRARRGDGRPFRTRGIVPSLRTPMRGGTPWQASSPR